MLFTKSIKNKTNKRAVASILIEKSKFFFYWYVIQGIIVYHNFINHLLQNHALNIWNFIYQWKSWTHFWNFTNNTNLNFFVALQIVGRLVNFNVFKIYSSETNDRIVYLFSRPLMFMNFAFSWFSWKFNGCRMVIFV